MFWLWLVFGVVIIAMLALDLGVLHRDAHEVSLREAALWTAIWKSLALIFNVGVFLFYHPVDMPGHSPGLQFLTGYLIELSLSMDNVFVWAVIFTYFAVPPRYQHRILFWGIVGAVVLRLTFILIGAELVKQFDWVLYIFGVFVLVAGIKMLLHRIDEIDPERNPVLAFARKRLRVTKDYEGQRFFVRRGGALWVTPLFLVLLVVETTDIIFAVDSIPAIFGITRDPFIIITSNIFAILGLRALYFLLAGMIKLFRYLNIGLAVILCFIGVKMLLAMVYHIPLGASLGVICGVLAVTILASVWADKMQSKRMVE